MSELRRALLRAILGALAAVAVGPVGVAMAEPVVVSIEPSSGPTAGGTPVKITGSGFVTGATVSIGGTEAADPFVVSETEITATTPEGPAGPAEVVVDDLNGISTGGPSFTFMACSSDPVIEEQPKAQTVVEPAAATFSVGEGALPANCSAAKIQWQVSTDGVAWSNVSGATSATLSVSPTSVSESKDEYRAVLTNAAGSTTSSEVALTVDPAPCSTDPVIEEQPKAQIVVEPAAATFSVGEGTVPAHCSAAAIQWQVSTDGATWSNVSASNASGATSATLSISPTSVSESKDEYRAVLTNGAGSTTSSPATLTVGAAPCSVDPVIEEQPKDQTVVEPGAASFSVGEGAVPAHCSPAAIQWQVSTDGVSWSDVSAGNASGATSATLSIGPTSVSESKDEYRAVLTNGAGSTTSGVAKLTVGGAPCSVDPVIEEQPKDQTVVEPAVGTFTAAGSTPEHCAAPSVQWYSKAPGAGSFSAISGATSPAYETLATTTAESGTKFEAVFKNAAGETATHEATLTVTAAPCSSDPVIEEQPKDQTVVEPAAASFTVGEGAVPAHCSAAKVQWQVSTNGVAWSNVSGATSTTLSIGPTSVAESKDEYRAVLTNGAGSTTSRAATLTVDPAPCSVDPVIEEQPKDQTVVEPAVGTFTAAGSTPEHCAAPSVQWYSKAPGAGSFSAISGATSPSYKTPATTTAESGTKFEAVFKNAAGETATHEATLTVTAAPCSTDPVIEEQPKNQTVVEPAAASFTVGEGAVPAHCSTAAIQWQVSTDGVSWSDVSAGNVSGATSATLSIGPTSVSESKDEYRAVLTNAAGSTTSGAATLTVKAAPCSVDPVIEGQPKDQTVTEPAAASFTVVEGAVPAHCSAAKVQWQVSTNGVAWSNVSGATSATLSVGPTSVSESNDEYRAVLTNGAGSTTSSEVTLTVDPAPCSVDPVIEEQPKDQTVVEPAAATFKAAGSTPVHCAAPSVQWYSKAPGATSFSAISGATSVSYKTPTTTTAESGTKFEAVFKNAAGETTTHEATLTVTPAPCAVDPAIEGQPKDQTVVEPGAASFTVVEGAVPAHCSAAAIQWQVSTDGVSWSDVSAGNVSGATSATLSISPTSVSESKDEYRAVLTNAAGSSNSSTATLTVKPPPPVVTTIEPSSGRTAGGTAVTVKGKDFLKGATVTIGSAASEVKFVSEEEITAKTAPGSGTQTVVVTDEGGSSTGGPSFTYIPPPVVTLNQPTSPSKNTTPNFTGSASDSTPIVVKIYAGATVKGSPVSTATATGTGAGWSSGNASPALEDGEYTATATQEGLVGNPAGVSPPVTFTVDTKPPSVTLNQPTALSRDTTPSFSGNASEETEVVVHIYEGSEQVATATAQATGGHWSSEPAVPALPSGKHTFKAVAIEASGLGNKPGESEAKSFEVDTLPPSVTVVQPGARSNNQEPTLMGTGSEEGTEVQVRVMEGSKEVGKGHTTVSAAGTWSAGLEKPLPAGKRTLTVLAIEKSGLGNLPGEFESKPFELDTLSPMVTIVQPTRTNDPTFSGTGSEVGTEVQVRVMEGSKEVGKGRTTVSAAGTWSTGPEKPLPAGKRTLTVLAIETSGLTGNPAGEVESQPFEFDTLPPNVTIAQPAARSSNLEPTFSGTGSEEGTEVQVRVMEGSKEVGKGHTTVTTGHAWSAGLEKPLPAGKRTLTVLAIEKSGLAGNPAGEVESKSFEVDTLPPTVTLDQPTALSRDTTPSFSGTASEETEVVVHIYKGSEQVATATAQASGGRWSSGKATPALPNGKNVFKAVAVEVSGLNNQPAESEAKTFEVDTLPPTVFLESLPLISSDRSPSFSGTASEPGLVTVEVFKGEKPEGTKAATIATQIKAAGSFTIKVSSSLESGQYTAIASEPSAIGNLPGFSEPVTFEIQTGAPEIALNKPPHESNVTDPTFSGTVTAPESEKEKVTVIVHEGLSILGPKVGGEVEASVKNGHWETGPVALAGGKHPYTVVASTPSAIGNGVGESAPATFIVNTEPPTVTVAEPPSRSNNLKPTFSGTGSEEGTEVQVHVMEGAKEIDKGHTTVATGGTWSATLEEDLPTGNRSFTLVATEQSGLKNSAGTSSSWSFVVDTLPPEVTIVTGPQTRSSDKVPSFSGTSSEGTPVEVDVYSGDKPEGSAVVTLTNEKKVENGEWFVAFDKAEEPLKFGEYTAVAREKSGLAGNPPGASAPKTFVVAEIPPEAITEAAAGTAATHTALYASVNPEGGPISQCYFEFGTTPSYGTRTAECGFVSGQSAFPSTIGQVSVFVRIYGLSPNTTYHERIVAVGEDGTAEGADETFTTRPEEEEEGSGSATAARVPSSNGPARAAGSGGVAAFFADQLIPSGRAARIGALLRTGTYSQRLRAPEAGTAVIKWYYLPRGAKLNGKGKHAPVLVASGSLGFRAAGTAVLKIRLTRAGKGLLRHARSIRLTATCTFTPRGGPGVTTSGTFELKR
jgi:IPT/TIG domain/Bacterial Ig-like domain